MIIHGATCYDKRLSGERRIGRGRTQKRRVHAMQRHWFARAWAICVTAAARVRHSHDMSRAIRCLNFPLTWLPLSVQQWIHYGMQSRTYRHNIGWTNDNDNGNGTRNINEHKVIPIRYECMATFVEHLHVDHLSFANRASCLNLRAAVFVHGRVRSGRRHSSNSCIGKVTGNGKQLDLNTVE